jgi:two-component system nitrate/nitrite sensor histidine kinase NarX
MNKIWSALFGRSILLGLTFIMVVITTIGIAGMAASVMIAEQIQGSGSAINVAGSLRKQSHRMGSQVLADAANGSSGHEALRVAIQQFEASLDDDDLQTALARHPNSGYAMTYRSVQRAWKNRLKPLLMEEAKPGIDRHPLQVHNNLLVAIDGFVDKINTMVAQLEADTEARIRHLRAILGFALLLTLLVVGGAMYLVHRGVVEPLSELLGSAAGIAQGDFSVRTRHVGDNELGLLGQAFNIMAEELSKLYSGLEQRVAEKTAALTRSNQSLELLYHSISRLHNAPIAPETYQAVLQEMEQVLGLPGSMACLMPRHDGSASILASSLGTCPDREAGECAHCMEGLAGNSRWHYRQAGEQDLLLVPLRDAEGHYGVLRLALPPGRRLEPWQEQLLEALSRHIGIALGISHKTEQERLLALQEERSVIARELHDSIAQSLSFMKIQASLLQPLLSISARRQEAEAILGNLREGITSAYRQLRELLATFRLKMRGGFLDLLALTVQEFGDRGGIPIHLETDLGDCRLTPNQEIHSLQIIREALYNSLRHARASQAWVRISHDDGLVSINVEDDGIGLTGSPDRKVQHYGLNIMGERAKSLGGHLEVTSRPQGGTAVSLSFRSAQGPASSPANFPSSPQDFEFPVT